MLGYTTPGPAPEDVYANNVWEEMWANAVVAVEQVGEDEHQQAVPQSVGAGAGVGVGAGVGAEGLGEWTATDAALAMDNAGPSKRRRLIASADARIGATQLVTNPQLYLETLGLPDNVVSDLSFGKETDAATRAENAVGAGLVTALAQAGDNSVKRVFASALRSREAEAEAEGKHAAVLSGKVVISLTESFNQRGDVFTHLTVVYTVGRKQAEEVVEQIAPLSLVGILHSIGQDPDPTVRDRLRPVEMVLASPRVYWNLVFHSNIGPAISFAAGCKELVPELDWDKLLERRRKLKYDSLEWAQ
jgi:hypothetical protein